MFRLIQWILSWALAIGIGSAFVERTYDLANAAVNAHQNDQISYSKFTRALIEAKPRQKTSPSSK